MLNWEDDLILSAAETLRVSEIATNAIDRTLALLAQTRSTLEALPVDSPSRAELLAQVIHAQQSALALRQERLDQLSQRLHRNAVLDSAQIRARLDALFSSFSSATSRFADFWLSCLEGEARVFCGHAFLRSLAGMQRFKALLNGLKISVAGEVKQVQTRSRAAHTRQIAPVCAPPATCYA
ncbi:hypothetical protein PSO31014_00414 [Pandoraea soli]|uniref:Uncharacterized protein n=2 Tax=Pandoraea soli TaxID=2508293 RepID=A0ABY6VN16_9BURK|nr:hypothetical protein PSO31014_00414 [Pandoraea soli]